MNRVQHRGLRRSDIFAKENIESKESGEAERTYTLLEAEVVCGFIYCIEVGRVSHTGRADWHFRQWSRRIVGSPGAIDDVGDRSHACASLRL